MGKECPECRLVEEEYTRAAAEELTHDALLLKLASLQVLLDKQSHERDSSMTNPDVYEILNRLQTPDAQVLRQAIENLKTERDFERCERFRVDELRSELVFAFGFQVGELRKKRDEWQATAEKAIDASSEGTWMARALDAERELATFKAECLHLRELRDSIDNLRLLRSSCPDSNDGDFRVHLSEKEWDMVTHLMDTCKNKG